MHDCRADTEALLYLHDIRLAPVWDTQVGVGGWSGGRESERVGGVSGWMAG